MLLRQLRLYLLICAAVGVALLAPGGALAHGGHSGPNQTVTQAVGPYELSVTIEMPPSTPAPLYLDIVPQSDIGDAKIELRAAPRGQSFASAPVALVEGPPGPQGVYLTELQVDRPGDWELEVRIDGAKGSGAARIPFTIVVAPLDASTIPLLASFSGLALLISMSIALSKIFEWRRRPMPSWINWLIGHAMFACVVVAAIFGIQQISANVQSAQAASGATPLTGGLPHANALLHTEPAAPVAGRPLTLTVDLSDGSTGLAVDDLTPHHDALMHLVVISADGAFFAHVHPSRVAPGRFAIALTPDRPGRYSAYVEITRQNSGVQVIARDFQVGGSGPAAAPPAPGPGVREVDQMSVNVTSSITPLKAGRQATLTFTFSAAGVPVRDMQPWLGMAGHLIAHSADGAIYGHIHALGPMAPTGPFAAPVSYGPAIQFVYTFPQPGRYQLWGQFKRNGAIVTVPVSVEVQ